jgi:Uma2 family endonuclease
MAVQPQPYRFTVEEYYRMAEAGILGEDDRVELIEGEIIEMAPIGSPHAGCVTHLTQLLFRGIGERATVIVQSPVRLDPLHRAAARPRAGAAERGLLS